jgi:hypothetical protein
MELKELIKKRIKENVANYDIGVIESYEYLIEMIAIEYHTQQSSITAVICRREQFCQCEELCNTNDSLIGEEVCLKCDKLIDRQNCI